MDEEPATIWVFLGENASWPSAVFSSKERAEQWVSTNALTGMLTEYPMNMSVYDWAIARDHFRPKQPKHTSTDFIAGFTTAYQDHVHFTAGVAEG